ncbi:hypothetical protein BDF22DRAFT_741530 [Syncephalis plumigaleata]|nr:hypothetical protein BDF22DRAFT_741530 [Syncephalis plumigaleata]
MATLETAWSMTHCICDLDSGVYWPVLALSDSNEAGYLFAGINRDGTRIQLETDDNGAIVADTAHLHMIDDGKVQIFQCRYLNSCWFCWELVEHTIINEMFSGTSTMTRYNHNDNDHSYRAHRQTRIVARGALFLSHNGPLQRVFTQYISNNQIQWEFLNLRLQRIIPVPERDFIVICDAKKRYLIRHLESGLPHYMDSWPAEAQLEQTIGSVFLLGNYGRNEHILHDIISGDRLFTLSGTEPSVMNSLGKRERLLDKDDVDTPPANSLPCTATCRPLLTSPVHLGQIDNRAGLFHYWAFA